MLVRIKFINLLYNLGCQKKNYPCPTQHSPAISACPVSFLFSIWHSYGLISSFPFLFLFDFFLPVLIQYWWQHCIVFSCINEFAIKFISQPASSSSCQLNWSTYSFIPSFAFAEFLFSYILVWTSVIYFIYFLKCETCTRIHARVTYLSYIYIVTYASFELICWILGIIGTFFCERGIIGTF